jgi:hypothetical protein
VTDLAADGEYRIADVSAASQGELP